MGGWVGGGGDRQSWSDPPGTGGLRPGLVTVTSRAEDGKLSRSILPGVIVARDVINALHCLTQLKHHRYSPSPHQNEKAISITMQ